MATTLANIEADIQQAREYALLGEYDHALACFNDAVSQVERRLASPSSVASGTGPIWEPVREELLEEVRLVREVRLRLKDLDMAPASTGSAVDRDSLPVGGGARGGGGGGHIWEQRSDQRAQPHHQQHTERSQQHQQHQHQQHQQHHHQQRRRLTPPELRFCKACNERLPRNVFSNKQWKVASESVDGQCKPCEWGTAAG